MSNIIKQADQGFKWLCLSICIYNSIYIICETTVKIAIHNNNKEHHERIEMIQKLDDIHKKVKILSGKGEKDEEKE